MSSWTETIIGGVTLYLCVAVTLATVFCGIVFTSEQLNNNATETAIINKFALDRALIDCSAEKQSSYWLVTCPIDKDQYASFKIDKTEAAEIYNEMKERGL